MLYFIEKYVTCAIPKDTADKSLRQQVLRFQIHRCRKYCRQKYKSEAKFYAVRHTITMKSPKNTYNLRRTEASKYINDNNPVILKMWNTNMDLQSVADN